MSDANVQTITSITPEANRDRTGTNSDGERTVDLERYGREMEPTDPVGAARKYPGQMNVSRPERLISIVSGATLVAYGLSRRGWAGIALAAAGGALALRGVSGHCHVYSALDISTAEGASRETNGVHVSEAITIDASPEELYGFWRNFENHALISDHLTLVKVTGPTSSHWEAKGPANRPIEWNAEIINDRPNERIAWKTMPGADIEHAGAVQFVPASDGRGTEVRVTMQYYPPAGTVGAGVAMLFRREPSLEVAETLRRLKQYFETGDITAEA